MHPIVAVLFIIASYLFGSLVPGYWAVKKLKNVDLTTQVSKGIGATNVSRALGSQFWILLFWPIDATKGIIPALIGLYAFHSRDLAVAAGMAAVVGHCFSIFLFWEKGRWLGGKAVSTTFGVVIVMQWELALICLLIFGLVLLTTGYVSISSMTAAASLAVMQIRSWGDDTPVVQVMFILACPFIFWLHRENIAKLQAGTENRLWRKT